MILLTVSIGAGNSLTVTTRDMQRKRTTASEAQILARLTARLGELIPASKLWRELAFPSASAARKARSRGVFPIEVFRLKGRRGHFARTQVLARWLARAHIETNE